MAAGPGWTEAPALRCRAPLAQPPGEPRATHDHTHARTRTRTRTASRPPCPLPCLPSPLRPPPPPIPHAHKRDATHTTTHTQKHTHTLTAPTPPTPHPTTSTPPPLHPHPPCESRHAGGPALLRLPVREGRAARQDVRRGAAGEPPPPPPAPLWVHKLTPRGPYQPLLLRTLPAHLSRAACGPCGRQQLLAGAMGAFFVPGLPAEHPWGPAPSKPLSIDPSPGALRRRCPATAMSWAAWASWTSSRAPSRQVRGSGRRGGLLGGLAYATALPEGGLVERDPPLPGSCLAGAPAEQSRGLRPGWSGCCRRGCPAARLRTAAGSPCPPSPTHPPPCAAAPGSAAGALNVICNFAELVVREMERDKVGRISW